MSFKIVQEFRKPGFIIIPEGLEKNGVFWLPPLSWSTKKRRNLLRNKFYLPDKSLWEARPCVVKKSRIATYELAEEQEELLLENNDSKAYSMKNDVIILRSDESCSEEESFEGQTLTSSISKFLQSSTSEESHRPRKHNSDKPQSTECKNPEEDVKLPLASINDDIWNCFQRTSNTANFRCRVQTMQNSASNSATKITQIPAINICETSHQNTEPVNRIDKDISLDYESECDDSFGCNATEKSNSGSSSKILSSILKNQQHHQEEMSKQLHELKIYIQDGLSTIFMELETLTQIQYSNSLSSVNPDIYPKKFCIENFKKVSTCEEANRLEKMLMISEFKADMVEKMSNIIGSKGTRIGEGWDCCYDLIETVFQQKFLKICSWTGASTSQMEDAKIAFLKYKNIISFFASVILNADPEFSFERTKGFFKEVLRSSSEFLNQTNRENSSDKITEDNDQHQSRKSIKRKLQEEDESESTKRQTLLRNNVFGRKIDEILLAANKVLHTAKELNMDDNEDDDENDNEDDNRDGNEGDSEDDGNEADKEDEPSSVIETE